MTNGLEGMTGGLERNLGLVGVITA